MFWALPDDLTQRISYLSGMLYYGQSLLTLVISVMPALIMLWAYPYQVGPGNYLPIAPAMLSMAGAAADDPRLAPGNAPAVRGVRGRAPARLQPTRRPAGSRAGCRPAVRAKPKKNRTPRRAAVIIRAWVVVTQGLMAWALARDVPVYGLPAYWIPLALAIMQAIVLLPLLLPGYGTTGIEPEEEINADLVRHLHSAPQERHPTPGTGRAASTSEGGGNQELQYYDAGSGDVQPRRAGHHRKPRQRHATRRGTAPVQFLSGKVWTKGKFEFRYGHLDVTASIPAGLPGAWPAIWLLGANLDEVTLAGLRRDST